MSYTALITDNFEAMVSFYQDDLGFSIVKAWDRPGARGLRLALYGLNIELLDNERLKTPVSLGSPGGRVHLVIDVEDIERERRAILGGTSTIQDTSWGARMFTLIDPDGTSVTFLTWQA